MNPIYLKTKSTTSPTKPHKESTIPVLQSQRETSSQIKVKHKLAQSKTLPLNQLKDAVREARQDEIVQKALRSRGIRNWNEKND